MFKKILFIIFQISFFINIWSQENENFVLLKSVLKSIEIQHKVTFNYLEVDIANIKIISPQKKLTLENKLTYLESVTHLKFQIIEDNNIIVKQNLNFKKYKIEGFVYSKIDNLPLENASILLSDGKVIITDSKGYFEIETNQKLGLTISYMGFRNKNFSVDQLKWDQLNMIFLDENIIEINEVKSTHLVSGIIKSSDGSYVLRPKSMEILPGLIEPDVFQAMLKLPGIYSTDESVSSINVRGGTHDQNLFLWNGIKIYQTGHFFGLISTLNPYLSSKINIYKNGSSAFYGDGVSCVVDISTNPNLLENNKFSAGINMINGDLYAKANLSNLSYIEVSGRKSITEFIQTPTYKQYFNRSFQNISILNYSTNESVTYDVDEDFNFYDFTIKYFHKINEKNKFIFDYIKVSDHLIVDQKNTDENPDFQRSNSLHQKNSGVNFDWEFKWNLKNNLNVSMSHSQYELDGENKDLITEVNKKQENIIFDNSLKFKNNLKLNNKYSFNYGYQFSSLKTESIDLEENTNSIINRNDIESLKQHSLIGEIFFCDSISNLKFTFGLRSNYIEQFNQFWIEPSINMNYGITDFFNVNLAAELKSQNTFQIIKFHNDFFGIEKRRWVLANNSNFPIQKSKQLSLELNYIQNNWLINVETYLKKINGINSLSQGFQNQYESTETQGSYYSKGIEFFIQKKINHFITSLNYNISDSEYNFPNLSTPVFTNSFELDKIFSFTEIYENQNFKFAIGSKWHSGKPETDPISTEINYSDPLHPYIEFGSPNSKYMSNFFQIDLSGNYKWVGKNKAQYKIGVSILNIFDKKNETGEFYTINTTYNSIEEVTTYGVGRTPNISFRVVY